MDDSSLPSRTTLLLKLANNHMTETAKTIAATLTNLIRLWDQQRAKGVPRAARLKVVEAILRQRWPARRAWTPACTACDDTGLLIMTCEGQACELGSDSHEAHTYGQACRCLAGRRYRPFGKECHDFRQAGQIRPRRMTRIGR